jgi:RNA polymerase sigma-70 factor, ECF subfamily
VADHDAVQRFTCLYERTRPRVYAFAVSHAGRELAEEIVSEVYLVAWRRLADIPRPELPWLLSVARNVAANQFRATVRQRSVAAELQAWIAAAGPATPDIADQVTERQSVLAALAALSAADRDLLTLVAWHGLTPAAAAQVMGCSTAAYFVRLHRARRRLERALRARLPARPPAAASSPAAAGPKPVRPKAGGPKAGRPAAGSDPARSRPPVALSPPEEGIR